MGFVRFLLISLLLGYFIPNTLFANKSVKRYYYIKDGEKVYLTLEQVKEIKRKKALMAKKKKEQKQVEQQRVKKKLQQKVSPEESVTQTPNFKSLIKTPKRVKKIEYSNYYLKGALKTTNISKVVTVKTKDIPGTLINLNGTLIPADGRTYAHSDSSMESGLVLAIGKKVGSSFYEGSLTLIDSQKEFDFSYGTFFERKNFSIFDRVYIPKGKLSVGFSYNEFEVDMPDSFSLGGSVGVISRFTNRYAFDCELYFKSKFFKEVSASFGTEDIEERQIGLNIGVDYSL